MTRAKGPDVTQPMPKAIVSADLQGGQEHSTVNECVWEKGTQG